MPEAAVDRGDQPRRRDVVELRVHGVSGGDPTVILEHQRVRQVTGDDSGGFHRTDRSEGTDPDGVTLEAYRWGDLPAGTVARTLSMVFLLPFMFSNVAVWMLPTSRRRAAGVTMLCRLLALNLTVLYVVSIAGVALDLFAWRCLGAVRCRGPFDTMAGLDGRHVGQRLCVLALLPIAAIVFLLLVGTRRSHPGGNAVWTVEPLVQRLRAIHVAAALAVLDLMLLVARDTSGGTVGTTLLLALSVVVLLVCVGLLAAPGLLDRAAMARPAQWTARTTGVLAIGMSAATLVVVARDDQGWAASTGMPGYGGIAAGALFGQMTLLVALSGLVLWHRGRAGGRSRLRRGLGAAVVAALAVGLAGGLSAGLVYQIGQLLGGYSSDGGPPLPYRWTLLAFFLHVVATALVCGGLTLLSRRRRHRAAWAVVRRDFPVVPPEAAGRLRLTMKTVARARFTEWLGLLATTYAVLATIGLVTSVLGSTGREPEELARQVLGLPSRAVEMGLVGSTYLLAALLLTLLAGGVFAYRTAWFRRHVGILWDLGTFWPRAAHPFAPPSYADRAVPELVERITDLTERHRGVLLCGHSHGSALLALAVLRLPPRVRRRVALLTYGSPLDRLYARLFPTYLNEEVLREVGERVEWRWLNLWRDTDRVGGWIFAAHRPGDPAADPADLAGTVDRRLRDPRSLLPAPGESSAPPILGHHPGETEPDFRAAVRELSIRLRHVG
ncbi:hypothetical protein ACWER9_13625 [Micromonospora sp. NPDC003944]